ncbi:MAG: GerMN domain-containing protein [Firmicutes bacterium]|nr:GerMN domain-containing protein [Bacillota bacterium]
MKKQLMTVLLLSALLLGGCGGGVKEWKDEQQSSEQPPTVIEQDIGSAQDTAAEATPPAEQPPAEQPDAADEAQPQEQQNAGISGPLTQVVLYFADSAGNLSAETRHIVKVEGIARATIGELIHGPQSKELSPTLPGGVELKDIDISNGICTVDFTAELKDHLNSGSSAEELAVWSIVDTLCQFDTVSSVKILVEGQELQTLNGNVDISATLAPADNPLR